MITMFGKFKKVKRTTCFVLSCILASVFIGLILHIDRADDAPPKPAEKSYAFDLEDPLEEIQNHVTPKSAEESFVFDLEALLEEIYHIREDLVGLAQPITLTDWQDTELQIFLNPSQFFRLPSVYFHRDGQTYTQTADQPFFEQIEWIDYGGEIPQYTIIQTGDGNYHIASIETGTDSVSTLRHVSFASLAEFCGSFHVSDKLEQETSLDLSKTKLFLLSNLHSFHVPSMLFTDEESGYVVPLVDATYRSGELKYVGELLPEEIRTKSFVAGELYDCRDLLDFLKEENVGYLRAEDRYYEQLRVEEHEFLRQGI